MPFPARGVGIHLVTVCPERALSRQDHAYLWCTSWRGPLQWVT